MHGAIQFGRVRRRKDALSVVERDHDDAVLGEVVALKLGVAA